ncbi:MAG: ATP-dependent RNA helicase, partial [Treponema sp.]|nr:ATP-dependent RNA helicase [Treponema sp.]
LEREWKRKKNFFSGEASLAKLANELPKVLLPALAGKKPGKELGFISLFTDFNGSYWFRCSRGFHTALNESLASLEALIDELEDNVAVGIKHEINQTYRRLADILNG